MATKKPSKGKAKVMKGQTHGGKGSSQRKTNPKKFAENYDAIFGKMKKAGAKGAPTAKAFKQSKKTAKRK